MRLASHHTGPIQRRGRHTSRLAAAAGCACAFIMVAGTAAAQAQPTISTGQVLAVTTTGAEVNLTVNPEGTDTYYQVLYGPTGGALSQMTGWQDAGSGSSPIIETLGLSALSAGTSYTYQAQAFQNATGQATTDPTTGTFTTTANPTGPGTPIIPPQNPASNGLFGSCSTDAQCVSDLNGDNALQDGVGPFALPSNWGTLSGPQQLFVATNLERVALSETPIPNLVDTYDAEVQAGVANDTDPALGDNLPETAVWAGAFPTPLGAVYGWLDNDGPGGFNLDCTAASITGCFGHRDALLDDPGGTIGNPTEMDAVAGTDNSGQAGYAAIFANNPNPTPAANIVFSWSSEQQFLAPPPLGGILPHGPVPKDSHLTLSPSSLKPLKGRKEPSIVLNTETSKSVGTVISYTDSLAATSTFTIKRAVTGVLSDGRCVAPARHQGRSQKACTSYQTVGSFVHVDVAGHNSFRYLGRLDGSALKPGAFLMSVSPLSAQGRLGKTLTHAFTVK